MGWSFLRSLRVAVLLYGGVPALGAVAQDATGICSITLLSDTSTLTQYWCLDPPVATIDPVVWTVEGTGVQVDGLPPGVTAVLSNDTLTISGTIGTEGIHTLQVSTSEGCQSWLFLMDMSLIVDPAFSCTVEGADVVLHWPGMRSTYELYGDFYVSCSTSDGFFDLFTLFLPEADSVVWSGLPTNTELTFTLAGNGAPYCFPGWYETTCTIITTDVIDHEEDDLALQAISTGDLLQLSASVELREVRIYDMLGALVASRALNARTANVPIASLAPGAFILRTVAADGRVSAQRFIRE